MANRRNNNVTLLLPGFYGNKLLFRVDFNLENKGFHIGWAVSEFLTRASKF